MQFHEAARLDPRGVRRAIQNSKVLQRCTRKVLAGLLETKKWQRTNFVKESRAQSSRSSSRSSSWPRSWSSNRSSTGLRAGHRAGLQVGLRTGLRVGLEQVFELVFEGLEQVFERVFDRFSSRSSSGSSDCLSYSSADTLTKRVKSKSNTQQMVELFCRCNPMEHQTHLLNIFTQKYVSHSKLPGTHRRNCEHTDNLQAHIWRKLISSYSSCVKCISLPNMKSYKIILLLNNIFNDFKFKNGQNHLIKSYYNSINNLKSEILNELGVNLSIIDEINNFDNINSKYIKYLNNFKNVIDYQLDFLFNIYKDGNNNDEVFDEISNYVDNINNYASFILNNNK